MSHDQQVLPQPGSRHSHDNIGTPDSTTNYGSPPSLLSPPPSSSYNDHSSSTTRRGASYRGSSSSAAAAVPDKDMSAAKPASHQLTHLERWAVRASPSQFNAIAGAVGGFTSGVVVCPLDVIKTKLQAQGGFAAVQKGRHVGHHKVYEGLIGTGKVIWKEEGIRGMYRGLGPIILGYLPTWAVWFTVYNNSKAFLSQYQKNTFVVNFWSSIIAGASSTIVTNPIWVIKTRLMSQTSHHSSRTSYSFFPKGTNTPTSRPTLHSPWHYRSTLDAARKMYTTEGITSFYSGLTPALLGLTHVAVQFPAYEYLKTKFTGQGMGVAPIDPDAAQASNQWLGVLSASILSKILASSATYPHEVIRTRLQTQRRPVAGSSMHDPNAAAGISLSSSASTAANSPQKRTSLPPKYRGIVRTFRTILAEEGWRAFYAGMGANMMRAVPAATVTMLTYEYVMRVLNQARADGKRHSGEMLPELETSR